MNAWSSSYMHTLFNDFWRYMATLQYCLQVHVLLLQRGFLEKFKVFRMHYDMCCYGSNWPSRLLTQGYRAFHDRIWRAQQRQTNPLLPPPPPPPPPSPSVIYLLKMGSYSSTMVLNIKFLLTCPNSDRCLVMLCWCYDCIHKDPHMSIIVP